MGDQGVFITKYGKESIPSFIKLSDKELDNLEVRLLRIENDYKIRWIKIGNNFMNLGDICEIKISRVKPS